MRLMRRIILLYTFWGQYFANKSSFFFCYSQQHPPSLSSNKSSISDSFLMFVFVRARIDYIIQLLLLRCLHVLDYFTRYKVTFSASFFLTWNFERKFLPAAAFMSLFMRRARFSPHSRIITSTWPPLQ